MIRSLLQADVDARVQLDFKCHHWLECCPIASCTMCENIDECRERLNIYYYRYMWE